MGRHGYVGESKSDTAINKMDKYIEKSTRDKERRGDKGPQKDTLIGQLKKMYPETWEVELEEIRREQQHPDYLVAKNKARSEFIREWNDRPRVIREEDMPLKESVDRLMKMWLDTNRKLYPVK